MQKDDKALIRSRLVEGALSEYDGRLARQNALVYSKIARYEFPTDWPDAITSLLDALRSQGDAKRSENALLLLLQVTKELSTGRLARTRQNLQAVTPEIIRVVGARYVAYVDSWRYLINEDSSNPDIDTGLKGSLLCIKTLRRLLITG